MFLISSNAKKLAEFHRFGLDLTLKSGDDLPEISGTPDEVALYKAKMAGVNAVVEDTILIVDGSPWIEIKWEQDALKDHVGKPVDWIVTLAHNEGESIALYRGVISGVLTCPDTLLPDSFGFDPFIIPNGFSMSLDGLERQGRKDEASARRQAVEHLLQQQPYLKVRTDSLPEWKGAWQNSSSEWRPRHSKSLK